MPNLTEPLPNVPERYPFPARSLNTPPAESPDAELPALSAYCHEPVELILAIYMSPPPAAFAT